MNNSIDNTIRINNIDPNIIDNINNINPDINSIVIKNDDPINSTNHIIDTNIVSISNNTIGSNNTIDSNNTINCSIDTIGSNNATSSITPATHAPAATLQLHPPAPAGAGGHPEEVGHLTTSR